MRERKQIKIQLFAAKSNPKSIILIGVYTIPNLKLELQKKKSRLI